MVHHSECPLCSSENIELHLRVKDYFISKEEFDIARCTECSFIFTRAYPDIGSMGRYYESDEYISHSDSSRGLLNKIYKLVRTRMLLKKRGIVRKATGKSSGSILDIGSGTGHFARIMKTAGWDSKGIEINKAAREISIEKFDIDVIAPENISSLGSGCFDCITLWHVLEHFHAPFQYAADIKRLLKPGGICIIALPNSNSTDAHYYSNFWAAWDVPRHLWHFNPETFRIFAEKNGFELMKVKRLPLDVFYISIISERYKGSGISFISGMIKAAIFAFRASFNIRMSSSLIYILRSPV